MKVSKPKILFIGGMPRGLALLKRLLQRKEQVVHAFIFPEDPHEPFQVSTEIQSLCRRNKISYTITRRIKPEDCAAVLSLQPDVAFVCGWRTIIPPELYRSVPLGCLAAHDALLPKYRGFAPTAWAIIRGESLTGVTLFKIGDGEADSGDVFEQIAVRIGPRQTASDVYPKIVRASVRLYVHFLNALRRGKVRFKKQDHRLATYGKRRTPEDGKIDWSRSSKEIFDLIRALQPPYPHAWTFCGSQKIYVKSALLLRKIKYDPRCSAGTIAAAKRNGVLVQCGYGVLRLIHLTDETGKRVKLNEGQTLG